MRITTCLAVAFGLLIACAPPRATSQQSPLSAPTTSPASEVSTSPSSTPTEASTPTSAPTPTHAPLLAITSANFHSGEAGIGYTPVTLGATGGVPAYAWSISVGELPPGLALSPSGSVSGTPTAAGTFAFTVHVTDTVAGSAIVNRSITVAPYLAASGSCNNPQCNVEQGCVTVCGTFGSQSGGVGPFSYAVTGGAIPTGMALSGLSLTGAFPPEPVGAAPQPWRFQVTVSDALGASANVTAVFHVFAHISLTGGSCVGGTGVAFTCAMPFSGGSKAVSGALVKGALPPGALIAVDPVKMQLVITIPAQKTSAVYTADLTVTDSSPCGPAASCTSAPATETIRV